MSESCGEEILTALGILLSQYWWQRYSSKFVTLMKVVAKLSFFVGSSNLIMVGCGWFCMFAVKQWQVVGGGGEIMAVHGRRQ